MLCPMFVADVTADDQHAPNFAVVVDRAVAIGPPDILPYTVAGDRNQSILVPHRAAAAGDQIDLRADDRPDFGPALAPWSPQRRRVPLRSHRSGIGIVIELNKILAPPDEH